MIIRLKQKYEKEVVPELKKVLGYKNSMAVPKIKKVVVNCSFGKLVIDKTSDQKKKIKDLILQDLSLITGRKPKLAKSKKAVSGFNLKLGEQIGAVVTLRRKKMYDFLERLVYLALPRSRDFKGISPDSVDKNGNLTIGIPEHVAFPEVFAEKEKTIFGLEATIVTTAENKKEGIELFKKLGFPLKKSIDNPK